MSVLSLREFRARLDATAATWEYHEEPWHSVDELRANNLRGHEMAPMGRIRRGSGPVRPLPPAAVSLDPSCLTVGEDATTLEDAWMRAQTDGVVVLHRGNVVVEKYANGMRADDPHAIASMSKSATGLVAELLIAEGALERHRSVARYVPELRESAFAHATVQHVLDMGVGIRYADRPYNRFAEAHRLSTVTGFPVFPAHGPDADAPRTFRQWLGTTRATTVPGTVFNYENAHVQAIAWVCEAVSGLPFTELLSNRVWSQFGSEADAWVSVDRDGDAMACAGMVMNVRDIARWGQTMLEALRTPTGTWGAAIAELFGGADPAMASRYAAGTFATTAAPGDSYHSYWYSTQGTHPTLEARGRWGQQLVLVPSVDLVYARVASMPTADEQRAPDLRRVLERVPSVLAAALS